MPSEEALLLRKELERLEKDLQKLDNNHEEDEEEYLKLLEIEDYEACEKSLYSFLMSSWHTFDGGDFKPGLHLEAISEHLEACYNGQIQNLIINIPPRCSKTSLVSRALPAWLWVKDSELKVINCSYSFELAVKDSVASRNIIQSNWYQTGLKNYWTNSFKLSKDNNQKHYYTNDSNGSRYATSTGGSLTGSGGDWLLIDDPIKAGAAHSKVQRESANDWFSNTLSTRLNDRNTGKRVVIAQRLHEHDLPGFLMEQGGWEKLILPMLYVPKIYFTSIGWSDWRTKKDEVLVPERFSEDDVENLKKELGPYAFAAQMQQDPKPIGGGMVKLDWFKIYYVEPKSLDTQVIAFDLSMTDSASSDNSAGVVLGRRDTNIYILDVVEGKMDIVAQMQMITDLCNKWPRARTRLVEAKANGQAVIKMLEKTISGLIPVQPSDFGGSKEARLSACIPEIYAGNVWRPDKKIAPWWDDFWDELGGFPKVTHDDSVDAFSYALNWLSLNNKIIKMPVDSRRDEINWGNIRSTFSNTPGVSASPGRGDIRKIFS